jgi:hypothetical protein
MQRPDASGAVRPIYGLLGFKGLLICTLMCIVCASNILVCLSLVKYLPLLMS